MKQNKLGILIDDSDRNTALYGNTIIKYQPKHSINKFFYYMRSISNSKNRPPLIIFGIHIIKKNKMNKYENS